MEEDMEGGLNLGADATWHGPFPDREDTPGLAGVLTPEVPSSKFCGS
jgi:hypothetical protein